MSDPFDIALDPLPEPEVMEPCDHEGCEESITMPVWLPDSGDDPDGFYCSEHAFYHGFCKGCGYFWGGIESFEFGNGYCDTCEIELHDDVYGDTWDDDFDYADFMDAR